MLSTKKIVLSIGILLYSFNPLTGMMYSGIRWIGKQTSTPFLVTTLTEKDTHDLCARIKDQGLGLTTERSIDTITRADLDRFIKKQEDASYVVINYLQEGNIKELKDLYNINEEKKNEGIPRLLLPGLIKIFTLKHLLKLKIEKEQMAQALRSHFQNTPSPSSPSPAPAQVPQQQALTKALAVTVKNTDKTDDPDKGILHNLHTRWSTDYAIGKLQHPETVKKCKALRAQALAPCAQPALDLDTANLLKKFTKRFCRTSRIILELLETNKMDKLQSFYTKVSGQNSDMICPVIQLYALRFLIQYQRSLQSDANSMDERYQNFAIAPQEEISEDNSFANDKQLLLATYKARLSDEDNLTQQCINLFKPVPVAATPKPAPTPAGPPPPTPTPKGTPLPPVPTPTTTPITTATPPPTPAAMADSKPLQLGMYSIAHHGEGNVVNTATSSADTIVQPPVPPKPKTNSANDNDKGKNDKKSKKSDNPTDDQTTY